MTGAFLSDAERTLRQKKELKTFHAPITRIEWWNQRSLICSVIEISPFAKGERERGGGGGRIDGRIAFRMTAALALNGSSLIDTPYHTVGLFDQPDLPIEGIGQWQNGDTRLPPPIQRMHPKIPL